MNRDTELRGLPFPNEMIGSRVIIQGASGAGKTYAIRKILETTYGKMQHFILDVEDELFTLREKFDYLLIGGEHADAALGNAAALARTLLELGMPAVIALNDLKLPEQRAFIGEFIMSMMTAPRPLWHPALVVLDESHRYAPNFGQVESSEALVHIATSGRKRGFGAIFATQRLSQLSKDILGQCPNRMMGRVDQSLDRRIAADILGFAPSGAEARELMRLKHQFWIVGPALAEEPALIKFAPCTTTHLHSGQRDVPPPPAPERVKAMLGALNRATKTAKAPGADRVAMPDHDALRDAEQRGYAQGKETGEIEGRNKAIQDLGSRIERVQTLFSNALGELASVCRLCEKESGTRVEKKSRGRPIEEATAQPKKHAANHELTVSAEEFLRAALGIYPAMLTWGQLGVLCGRKTRGGSFNTARKQILSGGYAVEKGGLLKPASVAFDYFGQGAPSAPKSNSELVERMIKALPVPASEMLAEIAKAGPIGTERLAERLGRAPRGGSWNTGMAILKANDLIQSTAQGWVISSIAEGSA